MALNPFRAAGKAALSATTTSSRVAAGNPAATQVRVTTKNASAATADDVYIKFGDSTVVATTSDYDIHYPVGNTEVFSVTPSSGLYFAAITASGSADLILTSGFGE